MKRKMLAFIFVAAVALFPATAIDFATLGGWHTFYDPSTGFTGFAKSKYIGNARNIPESQYESCLLDYIAEFRYRNLGYRGKVNKFEEFLILHELETWKYSSGDIYVLNIQASVKNLLVLVKISGKEVELWYAYDCEVSF